MKFPLKDIRWRLVFGAATATIALSFLALMGIIAVYALKLAFQARGSPDQAAINHFAANVSRALMPWFQCFFALIAAIRVARKTGPATVLNGVFAGTLAGLLGAAVAFGFSGQVNFHTVGWILATAGAGWLGAILGKRSASLS